MPWWLIILSVLVLAGGVAFGIRWYRHRNRLDAVARKHKMQRPTASALEELLGSLPEDWENAGFRDSLVGRDGSGRYLAARKGKGQDLEEIFLAELSRHTPARGLALRTRSGQRSEGLQMRWNLSPEQALDAQSRDIVQRVLREFAAFKMHHGGLQISLEIGDRGAIFHSPFRGDEARDEFIAAARVLRRDLMHCLYRRGTATKTQAVMPVQEAAQPAQQSPQPAAAPVSEMPVDAEVESALENLEAQPLVSTKDLVTEVPAPPTRKGWKRVGYREYFEVPDCEDDVEVISAQASSTRRKNLAEDQEKTKVITFLP